VAKLTLDQLERHLFAAADILRGTMDAAEYRDFLLVLLFLKRANDEFLAAREEIIEKEIASGASREEAEEEADEPANYTARRIMYVPPEARWERLAGAVDDVATQYLQPALDAMEGQTTSTSTASAGAAAPGRLPPSSRTSDSPRSSATSAPCGCAATTSSSPTSSVPRTSTC
jgi:type I restriction-modification system DNA methylase subunit